MTADLASGDELVSLLEEFAELEWAKCEYRAPKIVTNESSLIEDRSTLPPYTVFRLRTETPYFIKKLCAAVETYSGKVTWTVIKHDRSPLPGTNWAICPQALVDAEDAAFRMGVPVSRYFKEHFPLFGAAAYQDMLGLVSYLRQHLCK